MYSNISVPSKNGGDKIITMQYVKRSWESQGAYHGGRQLPRSKRSLDEREGQRSRNVTIDVLAAGRALLVVVV